MSTQKDDKGQGTNGGTSPVRRNGIAMPRIPWLPTTRAPANDNDLGALLTVVTFLRRHLNWLAPTIALAALSLAMLWLRT